MPFVIDENVYPVKNNPVISRYMDLTKFVSILQKKALFFSRVDKLEDPFEGTLPKSTHDAITKLLGEAVKAGKLHQMDEVGIEQAASNYIEQFAANKPFTVVSCWHANKGENAVMWHAYTNVKAGIMVRSTYEKLKDSIKDSIDRVHISEVKYLDYEKNVMLVNSTNFPFVHKHHFYQDEKEIRALIQVAQPNSGWNWEIQESQKGLFVKCNPEILIDEVIVAPFAEQSYFDIVRDVSLKYGLDKPVRYSGLRG